jgi:enoyl-CoA hydratase
VTRAGDVQFEQRGTVAHITFDRPDARNALDFEMYEKLIEAIDRLDAAVGVRVAVLRGAGGTFIAGTDIAQFTSFTTEEQGVHYEQQLERVVARVERASVPTLAVVEGFAAGGGLAIAAACDLRVCSPDARFGAPIARTVGNCLSVANLVRLVSHLGPSRTKAMLLLAEFLSAEDARAAGFVFEVVPSDALEARVQAICAKLATHAPITMQVTREALRRISAALRPDDEDLIRRAYGSRDFREGVAAFLEKRPPRWEGR